MRGRLSFHAGAFARARMQAGQALGRPGGRAVGEPCDLWPGGKLMRARGEGGADILLDGKCYIVKLIIYIKNWHATYSRDFIAITALYLES